MPIIVQKYGGSSVANAERILAVARRIGKAKDDRARALYVNCSRS